MAIKTRKKNSLKVLGLIWDRQNDVFKFDVTNLIRFIKNSDKTKRTLIRSAGRLFDPIGFLSPFSVKLKMLFQELWEQGTHWDEDLPNDIVSQWYSWCDELAQINSIKIPRYYFGTSLIQNMKSIQIHSFVDSSEKAYGAVIYVRYTDEKDITKVSFLVFKSRVAPLKKLTIPRLELTAALIGAKLISNVRPIFQELYLDVNYFCWTDSYITLCWIKGSSSRWKQFVANRVREIQILTKPETWHHCSGQSNPADLMTRKKIISKIINNNLWWSGPMWLLDESNWPECTAHVVSEQEILEIRKKNISLLTAVKEDLFDLKRFRNFTKIIRVTAWINRFINNLKMKTRKVDPLDSTEIAEAETYWLSHIQELAFRPERDALLEGRELRNNSRIKYLNPFLDEKNIIRVGGGLHYADITEEKKYPILLPLDRELSKLLIKDSLKSLLTAGQPQP